MRVTGIHIKNYKSFGSSAEPIVFNSAHTVLVGKNNAGKSNLISALELVLGTKNPTWHRLGREDFFDANKPIEIVVTIGDCAEADRATLFGLPNLTKQQKGALSSKDLDQIQIEFSFQHFLEVDSEQQDEDESNPPGDDSREQEEKRQDKQFEVKLWGFGVYRKVNEVRNGVGKMLRVPAVRDVSDELRGSSWTHYGKLMKAVLENSANYSEVVESLKSLNRQINAIFAEHKETLLAGARVTSYVDDIDFELTKEGKPSELLRNLEIFIKERNLKVNLENVGTGTQSAVIIGLLELALKVGASRSKLFCIEEPEAYIHPHGIRYLGDLLRRITSDGKTQVIASSHSPTLVSTFKPDEIIRVDKNKSETRVYQPTASSLSEEHFRRFINPENAELFFSARVVLVEGDTEKILLSTLGKQTVAANRQHDGAMCDFDKVNTGIIKLNGKENLMNFVDILQAFEIPYVALLDQDFINSSRYKEICKRFGIDSGDRELALTEFRKRGIVINPVGEIEDLVPNNDLVELAFSDMNRRNSIPPEQHSELRVKILQRIRQRKTQMKTSEVFSNVFGGGGKTTYALRLAEFYLEKGVHPFTELVRAIFHFDTKRIFHDSSRSG